MPDNTSSQSQRTSTSPALRIRNPQDDIVAGANTAILENRSPSNGYFQDGSWKGRYDRLKLVVLQQQSVQEKAPLASRLFVHYESSRATRGGMTPIHTMPIASSLPPSIGPVQPIDPVSILVLGRRHSREASRWPHLRRPN